MRRGCVQGSGLRAAACAERNALADDRGAAQSITKFLGAYRVTATVQVASAALSLPGLRKATPPAQNR